MNTEDKIAEQIAEKLQQLGFDTDLGYSNASKSAYVKFWFDAPIEMYDDNGDLPFDEDLMEDFKIRISDHDIPTRHEPGDYEVNTADTLRTESHSDNWEDAVTWASKIMEKIQNA